MANITVRVYSRLIKKLGTSSVFFDAVSVAGAISKLDGMYGEKFTDELYDEGGKIKKSYILTLNGCIIGRDGLEGIKLNEGDVLHIFPPVLAGG